MTTRSTWITKDRSSPALMIVALRLVLVGEPVGDVELAHPACLDADETSVPALDHAALAERDDEAFGLSKLESNSVPSSDRTPT